jgi:integrase
VSKPRRRRKRRAFGRVRRLRSGRWQAAYIGPDQKLHKAPHTFPSDVAAESWLALERHKIDLGTWGAVERSEGVTLAAYADRWLSQRPLRPRTLVLYRSLMDRLICPELGTIPLASVTPEQVRQWHTGLGAYHPTRNSQAYVLLHAICQTAYADELIPANPCRIRGASQTRRRRTIDILSPSEIQLLAAAMPPELRSSVLLAAWCGLRWGETSELRRKDVTADYAVLHVRRAVTRVRGKFIPGEPKTAAGVRDVAVPPHIKDALREHLQLYVDRGRDALLFPAPDGGHLSNDAYRVFWKRARAAIGKPNLRIHDLRHVGAVLAAQSGATTAELMHRLGHTTAVMALRYQHVAEGRDAEIAERLSKLAAPDTPDAM